MNSVFSVRTSINDNDEEEGIHHVIVIPNASVCLHVLLV